ncbi:hypothetical protein CHGG_00937 [Chaetomium globosum CBS 148.51]|uniref:Aminotransferase class V domain-containing protein n=1 Tax=Chaetomium globosum (strain ATCC 6205 / CBS 148.51 / DSM 1962 / NBRC 6347 / NRRL 1970) TaxID=306901 RepID=Q2HFR7_CHAGB|nr:uncharacterized protein CHGG_00937 [Chaetomium globosum CBS 148.51]EAQ92702.1 hypothetical protein CHGG_00937 [Chaetomium globosum CBS 148.51]
MHQVQQHHSCFSMAQSNILVRLSGRKRENHITKSNGNTKGSAPDISWRRRSLTSLRRRLSPGLKHVSSPTQTLARGLSVTSDPVHTTNGKETNNHKLLTNNDTTELPTPYSKPVELIRQEEYPHMNQGTRHEDEVDHPHSGPAYAPDSPYEYYSTQDVAARLNYVGDSEPQRRGISQRTNYSIGSVRKSYIDMTIPLTGANCDDRRERRRRWDQSPSLPKFGEVPYRGRLVRKESGHILALRKYFGGGTVSMVSTVGGAWHLSKGLEGGTAATAGEEHGAALHEGLEDGTLPFHSILALGEAIDVHAELYGSMDNISTHTTALMRRMYVGMRGLRYGNGQPLCKIYEGEDEGEAFGDARLQGATVAFNVFRADGGYESYATVERLANNRGVYVRSGGPDGIGLINELPTGVVRASLGAMSTVHDVDRFLSFLHDTFVARADSAYASSDGNDSVMSDQLEPRGTVSAEQHEFGPGDASCA